MLIPAAPPQKSNVLKANCAGQGCPDRDGCRRFQARIGEEWHQSTGRWISADLEREVFGECASFVRWHGERKAA